MPIPLRLLLGINSDGTPKRVSMFPPSYADRALVREMQRGQHRPPGRNQAIRRSSSGQSPYEAYSSAGAQTDVSYCTHECSTHKRLDSSRPPKKNSKAAQTATDKDSRQKQGKHKKDGRGKHRPTESSDQSSSEDQSETDPEIQVSRKQSKKQKTKRSSENWDPASFPWLTSLVSSSKNVSAENREVMAAMAKMTQESLAAARKADEVEAQRWVSRQQAATHHGAVNWLRERDVTRQQHAMQAAPFDSSGLYAALSDISSRRTGMPYRPPPVHSPTPNPHRPLWATEGEGNAGQFVIYQDENSNMYTHDGHPVQIMRSPKVMMQAAAPHHYHHQHQHHPHPHPYSAPHPHNQQRGRVMGEIHPNAGWTTPTQQQTHPPGHSFNFTHQAARRQSNSGWDENNAAMSPQQGWDNNDDKRSHRSARYDSSSQQNGLRHDDLVVGGFDGSPPSQHQSRSPRNAGWTEPSGGGNGNTGNGGGIDW